MTPQPILLSQEEIEQLRKEVGRPTLMGKSIAKHIAEVDAYMALGLMFQDTAKQVVTNTTATSKTTPI
ncbi:hypothetical protein JCM19231_3205 [Vibrio ishigakensis]|uniref:Uncharacterized protein n=1 Tax=Vibrio ishigakensis TaxID=1481914 RepID=A0A0B8NZ03_9VIBR|nr:hypothetical protein JCM19231_3205 [Vibrio ishigakensis]